MPEYTVVSSISNSYATSYVGGRKIVRDLDDGMHCCWADSNDIFYSKSADDGATWDTPEMVSDGQYSYCPSICVDSAGNIHVVWHGAIPDESSSRIRYRKRTDSWQTIVEFAAFGGHVGHQRYPVIAVDGNDYIHVIWLDYTADLINYRKYTDSWQPSETAASGGHRGPSMALDLDGSIHVVYSKETASQPGDYQVLYIKNTGGSWSSVTELTDVDENQDYPCIAVDRHNYVHVVWVGRTAVSGYVQVRYKKYTTSWQAIEEVTTESYHQQCASVSVDGDDDIYVIFSGATPESPDYTQIQCRRNTGSWQAIEYITAPDPAYSSQHRDYPSVVSSLFPVFGALRPNMPNAGWAGVYTEYRSYGDVFVRYYASSDLEWPGPDDSFVLSKIFLTTREAVESTIELSEPPLIDRTPSFWFLESMSGIPGSSTIDVGVESPTLHKVPFKGSPASLDVTFGASSQHYHSFSFDENVDWYSVWSSPFIFQQEKVWAYDQHNNHLAILAKNQKAIHIYNLNSDVEDIIYSLQADEFENAVGIAFSDGRVDVFIPTVQTSGSTPTYYFLFTPVQRESGGYLPYLYSFNIDETSIDGLVLYSKAAVESQIAFDQSFGVLSAVLLEGAVYIPIRSKLEFVEDFYARCGVLLEDDYFLKSSVTFEDFGLKSEVFLKVQPYGVWGYTDLLDCADFLKSDCILAGEELEGCKSECLMNTLDPDEQVRSKVAFADPYQWGLQSRVTAIGDYLLLGLMSNIYTGSLEDPDAAFYLILFNRKTFKCIWSKRLKNSKVTGTTLYDGWLWEDIKAKDGFTHIFTEGKFEIELFDCFGESKIALARFGKLNAPYTIGTVWEEYDINLENPCNINLVKSGSSDLLYPNGFVFKSRDPYDLPIKIWEPKKDYLCYTLRCKSDFSQAGELELFQRNQIDEYYTFAGSTAYGRFSWLVAFQEGFSCAFVKAEVALNIDYSYLLSKAFLALPDPFRSTSILLGQVNLQESLVKIIQSRIAFEDSNLLQSKVFMDDYLVRSSVDFIDNKGLSFYDRCVVGNRDLTSINDSGISGSVSNNFSIARIGEDNKAYHSHSCFRAGSDSPSLVCRPVIIGKEAYYIVRDPLYNWINPPPWSISHYFLWKVNLNTYVGTYQLPDKLYHKQVGPWPDADVYSVDFLVELEKGPLLIGYWGWAATPLIYLDGRLLYLSYDGGVYAICCIWLDPNMQEFYPLNYILSEYSKIVSIDTDGVYLYVLGYKSDIEGLWLIKLNTIFSVLEERVIFKGRLHTTDTSGQARTHDAQFVFWDGVNNQFIIGVAPVAGRNWGGRGYGAIVYSPVDGSIKWWKNYYPSGIGVHTLPGKGSIYFQRRRDDVTVSMYTKHGDYLGTDLDLTDLGGSSKFDMRQANVREVWIENFMQSKTTLLKTVKDQDNPFPDMPEPTWVPRQQRFKS